MPQYEHTFLARQDVTAQQVTGLMNTYKAVIEENGGKVGKTEYWGLKSTAYKIKKNRRAHYAFFNIDAPFQAAQQVFPSGHGERAKDREGGDGPETCSPPLVHGARGMGLRAAEEGRFATRSHWSSR